MNGLVFDVLYNSRGNRFEDKLLPHDEIDYTDDIKI